jgi:minor extracellular serine protease Vpr
VGQLGVARTGLSFALLVVFTLAVAFPARADDPMVQEDPLDPRLTVENGAEIDESATSWFVELAAPSTSDGGTALTVAASHDAFKNAARARGVGYTQRFEYGDLWNGFAVDASGADVSALRGLAGVKNLWPVTTVALPAPEAGDGETIDLATAIQMTHADVVQNTLGITGKNVKVALIDTGIDYDNPDLGGCFGLLCRVFTGWDFVGDDFNADSTSTKYSPTPVPDADPDDKCNGHGTHVAGIVGANGVVKGVAPAVRFGAYRVFGCEGSTTAAIMLAAMERVLADRMDVLNMSIGSAFQWPQYPTAVGADRLVTKHGVVVVASIGNNGPNGLYAAGAPGLGANVIGVASFDNTIARFPSFTISGIGAPIGYTQTTGSGTAPTSGSLPITATGTPTTLGDGCVNPPAAGSLAGKAVLIRRGSPSLPAPACGFYLKAKAAQDAGASAVVLYNNAPGFLSATVIPGAPPITIPVVAVTADDGLAIFNRIRAGGAILTWTPELSNTSVSTANLISSFSSFGPSPDLTLKPDIGAPGGFIYSTLPLELGGHGVISGTSMASPHVAGAVALLLESRPKSLRELGPQRVLGILQNSAKPHSWGNPGSGLLDNVHRQGAGMLDIQAAIEASAEITPGKLSLGESQADPATRTLTVTSLPGTGKTVTYTFDHEPALATNGNINAPTAITLPSPSAGYAAVEFSSPSVTVKNNQSASVQVTITPPANTVALDHGIYGGYITISGDDKKVYRVPYTGFIGDYQSIRVLTTTKAVARQNGWFSTSGAITPSLVAIPAGYVFTMGEKQGETSALRFGHATFTDVPNYELHMDVQSSRATFTAYDATGATRLGEAMSFESLPRNSTGTTFFAFAWDGFVGPTGDRTQLPNGEYVLKLTLVKALGDASNPAHVETATFAKVKIQRP